jgi:hypothetical protein
MRHYVLLVVLAFFSCSDSSGPESHLIATGSHTLELHGCGSCSLTSTPGFALLFRDGATITLDVSAVSATEATATVTSFSDNAPAGLVDATETMDWTEQAEGGAAYLGRWTYSSGLLTLGLRSDGSCEFGLLYPGVNAGATTCAAQ